MIAQLLTRRSVVSSAVIGGLVGSATLSGCSFAALTTRKVVDPAAGDRGRIARAITLSLQVRGLLDTIPSIPSIPSVPSVPSVPSAPARAAATYRAFAALHDAQIAQFARSAGLPAPTVKPLGTSAVNLEGLRQREQELARALRDLAMTAVEGEVAALLASAAAGIDQALAR